MDREGPNCYAVDHPSILLVLSAKELAFKFSAYIFEYRLLPYVHLASTHVVNALRPSLFVIDLPLLCIIVNANGR